MRPARDRQPEARLRARKYRYDVILRPVLCRPFIGRREELAYLHERRIEAAASHGAFVLVAGDAGIGKSRLIGEFSASLAYTRWRFATGACPEFGSRPYGPILEALARVDDRPFALGAAASKHEQAEAIVARFRDIAERRALVVVVDDLHWADAATLEFLAYFGERTQNARILTIASLRAAEVEIDRRAAALVAKIVRVARAARIEVPPLHGTELRAFIDGALDEIELPDYTRRAVARDAIGLRGEMRRPARSVHLDEERPLVIPKFREEFIPAWIDARGIMQEASIELGHEPSIGAGKKISRDHGSTPVRTGDPHWFRYDRNAVLIL